MSIRSVRAVGCPADVRGAWTETGVETEASQPASWPPGIDSAILKGFQWRSIGPARGGRSIGVSGVKGRPREAYFGAVGGGLWKTVDGGENWMPVTDGQIKSSSVGAVAVAESNPEIVFIGMGESCIRGNLTIEILDSKGQVAQTILGAPPGGRGERGRGEAGDEPAGGRGRGGPPTASTAAGLHRITWSLNYPEATAFPGMVLWGATTNGPAALPGSYEVRLTADGRTHTKPLTVKKHPLRTISDADLQEQFTLAMQIRDKVSEANNAVIQIRNIKRDVAERLGKSNDARLKSTGERLTQNLSAVEEEIYQVRNQSNQDPLNFPIKINNRLASLLRVVTTGEGKPIANAAPIFKDLSAELKVQTDRLQQVISTDLPAFNVEAERLGLGALGGK